MADDISQGQPDFSISQEAHCLQAEGRESGKPAEEANDQESPHLASADVAMTDELRQKANQYTSHEIDG